MGKPAICICENKSAVTAKLISAFVFATRIVQSLYFLSTKFHASSCLLLLCSPVLTWSKTTLFVFPRGGSNIVYCDFFDRATNEYPQSTFWTKNRYVLANPSFTIYMKVGFKWVFIAQTCFPDEHKL